MEDTPTTPDANKHNEHRTAVIWLFIVSAAVYVPVYAWLNQPEMKTLSLLGWSWRLLLASVEFFFYVGFANILLVELLAWRRTTKLLGWPDRDTRLVYRQITKEMRALRPVPLMPIALTLVVFAVLGYFLTYRFFIAGIVVVTVIPLKSVLKAHRPAAVLFLSKSSSDKITLHARLSRMDMFTRSVSLLDDDEQQMGWEQTVLEGDCLRTKADGAWCDIVESLMKCVPIIVVDAREPSPATAYEVQQLVEYGLGYKVICLVGNDGNAPVLEMAHSDIATLRAAGFATTTEDIALPVLEYLLSSRRHLPRKERSTANLISQIQELVRNQHADAY